jgi:AdoMet-dependent heme synthase
MKIVSGNKEYEFFFQLVQIEITGKCNIFCKHCRASEEAKEDMDFDTFKRIVRFGLSERDDIFRVTLSGGEPFINPRLPEFLDFLKENKVEDIIITTNGSIHNEEILEQIKQLNFKNLIIQISVDFPDRGEHDKFRGFKGAYEKAMRMLELLRERGISSSMKSTITRETLPRMEELVTLAISKGAMRIGFGTVIPSGRGSDCSLLMSSDEKKRFIEEVNRLKKKYPQIDVTSEDPLKVALEGGYWSFCQEDLNDAAIFGGCSAGVTSFNVSSDGTITPCSVFSAGIVNIRGKTIEQIRAGYANSEIIKNLIKREFSGKCEGCKLKMLCGGCRAIPLGITGNYLGEDTTCWRNA